MQQQSGNGSYGVSIHTPTKGVTFERPSVDAKTGVSIHTPTKGVTALTSCSTSHSVVSIHTPTKGVTSVIKICCLLRYSFNPHTHEGCDYPDSYKAPDVTVSIHTPTKGVTQVTIEKSMTQ